MKYVLSRLSFLLLSLWVAVSVNFVLPRLMPGNPAILMLGRYKGQLTPRALHALELQFGITHQPLWHQYLTYIINLLHGNLGLSLTYYPVPVSQIIAQSLPWTLGLVGTATIISMIIGTAVGVYLAWNHGKTWDNVLPTMAMFTMALPYFWLALVLLYFLAYVLHWFPLAHAYSTGLSPSWTWSFVGNVVDHALLPALTIVVSSVGGWMIGMRNNMIQTLGEDYITFAEAKGVNHWRLMFQYAARNAILPSLTSFAMSMGFVVGGALLTETVFSYPGMGYQLLVAVENEDYPLMQGLFLMIALAVLLANFFVEILYGKLDPRARQGQGGAS
ncbi:ABC transporter permease [Sulfobacillus thermosulfidooxidans]|uniref:ABC transporter permease n=1 Tax=Sulfobacillus thermosulfidooxidans TaxID=28034 RepID=UPI00096BA420|nr:ABC transporter permease [Sulfobacillus thermosulfidooxidans]OLZ11377.1 peptide ABC transporter permease [Sulfobacillus thermosulfidooxidans]OLZ14025.1 peptide ABC transporter permease [Sulfobacillus thermosulfidooxidans]OLZ19883.1 peptide ABC transporter permease [Sulfobacillus thermosulfidooxidans]